MRSRHACSGFTYLEMVATAAILMILASAVLPMARVVRTRQKEIELRRSLRIVRTAIDEDKIGGTDVKVGSEGYPPELATLVKGVSQVGKIDVKLKFLRRIPQDPMTGTTEWGERCYQDDADSTSWCGDNVWDVYSKSTAKALDGSRYKDW